MDPDVIIRHPKERKSKCSLEPLRGRPDLLFYQAGPGFRFDGTGYLLLGLDGPVIGQADLARPLLLLDSTWRLLPRLEACVTGNPALRSLPPRYRTAYPRVSKLQPDPSQGLASVEALFLARYLQGRPDLSLLDEYRWKVAFLRQFNDL